VIYKLYAKDMQPRTLTILKKKFNINMHNAD
jgi:hypothetical protein